MDEARRFYGELVGLEEIDRPETMGGEGVWFALGERELHVGTTDEFNPALKAHPALRLGSDGELDALRETAGTGGGGDRVGRAVARRAPVLRPDPWGNRVEFLARAGNIEPIVTST